MNQEQATTQAEKTFNSAADYFDDPVMFCTLSPVVLDNRNLMANTVDGD